MDLSYNNLDIQTRRSSLRSSSQGALSKEYKTYVDDHRLPYGGKLLVRPVDGLKKLAASYKNTVKGNKLEMEKIRSNIKEKRTLTDPRFRRTTTRKAVQSKSDSRFGSAEYVNQVKTQSSPMSYHKNESGLKVVSEGTRKEPEPASAACSPAQKKTLPTISPDEVPANLEIRSQSAAKAKNRDEDEPTYYVSAHDKDEGALAAGNCTNNITSSSTSGSRNRNSIGNRNIVKLNHLNKSPYWDDPRLLRKYANLINVKKAKSSMTLPFALPKIPDSMCVCSKCSCHKDAPNEYTFEKTTADTNSIKLEREVFVQEHVVSLYHKIIFYIIGCLCGLSLVAFVAWILSNDVIWQWVNQQREPVRKRKSSDNVIIFLASYIAEAVFFTLNFVFDGIYNFFMFPRNAVFSEVVEPPCIWKYFE